MELPCYQWADNVIFLLVANMNPDGTTMVASWYREHLGKPREGRPPGLWHKYAGHDNNRDWFMMNLIETRNSAKQLYRRPEPCPTSTLGG